MKTLKIATAQFQPKDGDKDYNFSVIESLTKDAKAKAQKWSHFTKCVLPRTLSPRIYLWKNHRFAENVPNGPSIQRLISLAKTMIFTLSRIS